MARRLISTGSLSEKATRLSGRHDDATMAISEQVWHRICDALNAFRLALRDGFFVHESGSHLSSSWESFGRARPVAVTVRRRGNPEMNINSRRESA